MRKNNMDKLNEICGALMAADTVLVFPHILMDGDTIGSSAALCSAMRQAGKTAYVLIEDEIPGYLKFLDTGLCTRDIDMIKEPDVCIAADCADLERIVKRREKFFEGKKTICIDHHKTAKDFAELNYIDNDAAATGEIVFDMLKIMEIVPDKTTGEALYAAILTDTGNFQYSNTTVKTHLITVELYNHGIDHNYVSRMLYQNTRIQKLHISGKILSTIKMFAGGEVAMAYVTREMLKEADALMEDTEGASEMLRNIGGVELSIFVKEAKENETKFSMRSKQWVDGTVLSLKYGGGGHSRAAGCTMKKPIFEAMKIMEADVEEYFAAHSGKK